MATRTASSSSGQQAPVKRSVDWAKLTTTVELAEDNSYEVARIESPHGTDHYCFGVSFVVNGVTMTADTQQSFLRLAKQEGDRAVKLDRQMVVYADCKGLSVGLTEIPRFLSWLIKMEELSGPHVIGCVLVVTAATQALLEKVFRLRKPRCQMQLENDQRAGWSAVSAHLRAK